MEIWKEIKFSNFEVSNYGNIRNYKTLKLSKLIYICGGKLSVHINKKYFHVGILVAEAFIEIPKMSAIIDVEYKDTCFFNNNINNIIPIIKNYERINF